MVYTIIVKLTASNLENAELLAAKLIEAATIYRTDKEQLGWMVHRDPADPLQFAIVERFLNCESQKYHLGNPYWLSFDPYVLPLLACPMDLSRWEELDVPVPNQDSIHYVAQS